MKVYFEEGPHPGCWSCSLDLTRLRHPRVLRSAYAYESAVEKAEELVEFSIAELVYAVGPSPTVHGAANRAVHDMRLHGLVRCVKRGINRNRCLRWELLR